MSRRRSGREPEPGLFDLPLDGPVVEDEGLPLEPEAPRKRSAEAADAPGLPLDAPDLPLDETPAPRRSEPEPRPARAAAPAYEPAAIEPEPEPGPGPGAGDGGAGGPGVSLSARYLAGLADLAVHLALAVVLLFGARLLGVPADLGDAPALVVFLLIFSFLYTVVPLAFWGQTPGMAWAGLVARTPADESLTFGQTARRWLGGVLSVLLLSVPVVLPAALTGRSLADRLSGSVLRAA